MRLLETTSKQTLGRSLLGLRRMFIPFHGRVYKICTKHQHRFHKRGSSSVAIQDEINVNYQRKKVTIDFMGLKKSSFHASWLWSNDPAFCHETSGQRLKSLSQFNPNVHEIVSAHITQNIPDKVDYPPSPSGSLHPRGGIYSVSDRNQRGYMLQIGWKSGEKSYYDLDWLSRFAIDHVDLKDNHPTSKVTKRLAIGAINNPNCVTIPTFDYHQVMKNERNSLFQTLHMIMKHGAVLVQNAPPGANESTVADLGKLISGSGKLSHGSLYGDVFHVKAVSDPNNIAFTSVALPPHQDLVYYESKPFLQLLHCAQNALVDDRPGKRGESTLIDAMAAVEELRQLAPKLFQTLLDIEATFCKQRQGADMVSAKPHIVTSPYDQSVVAVNWAPPFEGPLQLPISKVKNPNKEENSQEQLMDDYFLAYQAMECILNKHSLSTNSVLPKTLEKQLQSYAKKYTWEYALRDGEILVFNNQRMLHGRRAFSMSGGMRKERHLIGCYTDAMDTISHYRILLRQQKAMKEQDCLPNTGNGSRSLLLQ